MVRILFDMPEMLLLDPGGNDASEFRRQSNSHTESKLSPSLAFVPLSAFSRVDNASLKWNWRYDALAATCLVSCTSYTLSPSLIRTFCLTAYGIGAVISVAGWPMPFSAGSNRLR